MKYACTLVVLFGLFSSTASLSGQHFPRISEAERLSMLTPPSQRPVRMVLDTDTYNEIDDQFALVYALISPELDVQAVYAAPFTNKRSSGPGDGMEKSYEEILRVLDKLGRSPEGFAFKGSTRYLTDLKRPKKSPAALDLVRRARQSSPEDPLYVVPVGAITNISNAILIDPSIIRNIVVVWLGGNGLHWSDQREFNFRQDLNASRLIFDCGVPFVQLPCRPVVTHFTTTVPEMERYVGGRGAIGDYLLKIFKAYRKDHFGWSKILWDMTAVAWLINDQWLPSDLVHSPIVTDNYTYRFDDSRHLIRSVKFVHRDPIYRDFFTKLEKHAERSPLARTVDLDEGESCTVSLTDGSRAQIKLLDVKETRDRLCNAVRAAEVTVSVNGKKATLSSAMYHLPVTVAGLQIDCPVTAGFTSNSSKENAWGLDKDARLRLWPAQSPWLREGSFGYPVRQGWFASGTQMANEPVFIDGGDKPGKRPIYYHYGLDFGGAEGLVEVLAATDGLVVSAAGETLADYADSPARARYDVIYVLDRRGWYYRYSHLKRIDVKMGQRVVMGQPMGRVGKEGGSGGWSHLHFDISSKQPSGKWGIQDGYAYAWEAYQREYTPPLIAVARPHQLVAPGQTVVLDGRKSWSRSGTIARYQWRLSDGRLKSGACVERRYDRPGTYSEVLEIRDRAGRQAWDFAVVQVVDPETPAALPPSIHAAYHPTQGLRVGDPVCFKVRSFRNTHGKETWDFGDGSPKRTVKSDGNQEVHDPNGYAQTEHRYSRAGHYLVRVERSNQRGEKATAHLMVHIGDYPAKE
jgi:inosine-uridine nucleoside N-ribohydrolase/murein DD-endopeptidase MepM/ murein hydrolase activator NlpD